MDWTEVSRYFPGRSAVACAKEFENARDLRRQRAQVAEITVMSSMITKPQYKRWKSDEDERLIEALKKRDHKRPLGVNCHRQRGVSLDWAAIGREVGGRTAMQCMYRWYRVIRKRASADDSMLLSKKSSPTQNRAQWPESQTQLLYEIVDQQLRGSSHQQVYVPMALPSWLCKRTLSLHSWNRIAGIYPSFGGPFRARYKWESSLYYRWLLQNTRQLMTERIPYSSMTGMQSSKNRWLPVEDSVLLYVMKLAWPILTTEPVPLEVFDLVHEHFLPHRTPVLIQSRFVNYLDPRISHIQASGTRNKLRPEAWSVGQIKRLLAGLEIYDMDFKKALEIVNKTKDWRTLDAPYQSMVSSLYSGSKPSRKSIEKRLRDAWGIWGHVFWNQQRLKPLLTRHSQLGK